ncbi:MAG: MFS transporter [Jatrophihabitans sp.]
MAAESIEDATVPVDHPVEPTGIFSGPLRILSAGLLILVTLIAFEAMAVGAALPTAARELHGLAGYGWAFTGFLVANIVAMVASGLLSDRSGPRLPLVAGLVLFLAGLVIAGTAPTMWQLVLGRVVQGLGSGLMITAIYVVIGEAYPAALRPKFFGAMSSAWVLPSLIGPPVSGFLTQHLSWRLVFLGLAPIVVIGGLLMLPALRSLGSRRTESTSEMSSGMRLLRAVAVAAGIALLEEAGQHPRVGWLIAAPFALALVIWALHGLLPPGTARIRRGVPTAVAFRGILAGAFFGVDSLIPLSLSEQHGYGATAAAMPLLGSAVGWSIGSMYQGRYRGPSRHVLVRAGFTFIAIGAFGTAFSAVPSGYGWLAYPAWALAGVGAGLGMSTVGVLLLEHTNDADRGRDSAALQLADGVTSAFTTGVGGVLVAAAARGALSYTTAFVTVDLLMVALVAAGAVMSGRARTGPGVPVG